MNLSARSHENNAKVERREEETEFTISVNSGTSKKGQQYTISHNLTLSSIINHFLRYLIMKTNDVYERTRMKDKL